LAKREIKRDFPLSCHAGGFDGKLKLEVGVFNRKTPKVLSFGKGWLFEICYL
jgi:hypothetical protein